MSRFALIFFFVIAGCGGDETSGDPPGCRFAVSVVGGSVDSPVLIPETVVVTSTTITDFVGFTSREWSVASGGEEVTFLERDEQGESIEFLASEAGPYDVTLSGDVGGAQCEDASLVINAIPPDAESRDFVLMIDYADGGVYVEGVTLYSGADFGLGVLDRDAFSHLIFVADDSDQAQDAVVRIAPAGSGVGAEVMTEEGTVSVGMRRGAFDLDILPYSPDQVPFRRTVSLPPPARISTPTPATVAVEVASVIGADVRLSVAGGPGSTKETNGDGQVEIAVAPGQDLSMLVVPPVSSSLPRLHAELSGAVPAAIDVAYAAIPTRSWSFTVLDDAAAPLPNAKVTLRGTIAAAAVVSAGAIAGSIDGELVATFQAGGDGSVGPIVIPNAEYRVTINAASVPLPSIVSVDLTTGQVAPTELSWRQPASVSGRLTAGGTGLAGVVVEARAQGGLAGHGATTSALTDGVGDFSMALVDGGDYELFVRGSATHGFAALRSSVTAVNGASFDLALEPGIRLSGTVLESDGPAAHAFVRLVDRQTGLVVGTAPTAADGSFTIQGPDPSAF